MGYGGTKSEMERLLADAEKLTGVKYDIDNLGDVYSAIHEIQKELGVAGVAAAEAEGTFTGSSQAMKAAWENLKADMALGKDITEDFQIVATSAKNYLMNNLLPMIGNVLKGLPTLVGEWLKNAFNELPGMVETATTFITNLADGIKNNGGTFINGMTELLSSAWTALSNIDWLAFGGSIINLLWTGIQVVAPKIWSGIKTLAAKAANFFTSIDWPAVGKKALELIGNAIGSLGRLIWDALSTVGTKATEYFKDVNWAEAGENAFHKLVDAITSIGSYLWEALTTLGETAASHFEGIDWGQAGMNALKAIGNGLTAIGSFLWEALSTVGTNAMNAFQNIDWENAGVNAMNWLINGIKSLATNLWSALKSIGETGGSWFQSVDWAGVGMKIINFIVAGIQAIGSFIWGALKTAATEAWNGLTSIDWSGIGHNIITGIVNGIKNFGSQIGSALLGAVKGAWSKATNFLQIGSPSKLMADSIGKWIPLGIAEGIETQSGSVLDAMNDIAKDAAGVNIIPKIGNVSPFSANAAAVNNIVMNITVNGADNPEDWGRRISREITMELRMA